MANKRDILIDKFVEDYNELFNVPDCKASRGICEQYRNEHPNEFKNSEWSIEKHRKRFMDWMGRQASSTLELLSK